MASTALGSSGRAGLVVNHDAPAAQDGARWSAVAAAHLTVVNDHACVLVPDLHPERVGIAPGDVAVDGGDQAREISGAVDGPGPLEPPVRVRAHYQAAVPA